MSADANAKVPAAGYGDQPPPPSYASHSAPAAYMAPPAAPGYAGGPPYGAPQNSAYPQYGYAPIDGRFAQPAMHQNVHVNLVGVTAPPPPQTIVVARSVATVIAPSSYLGWSIFNLLCCFWPLGLAALIFSIKVGNSRTAEEARAYSLTARNLNIAATVIAPVLVIIIVGAVVGTAASTATRVINSYSCYYYNSYYGTYTYTCR